MGEVIVKGRVDMKVGILYSGFSNASSVRPLEMKRFLDDRGCRTVLVDLERMLYSKRLKMEDPIKYLMSKVGLKDKGKLVKQMERWADVIERDVVRKNRFDLIICESFVHAYIFTRELGCVTLFDCPTPFVDELKYSGKHGEDEISALRDVETAIYEGATHVAFHWETYKDYVQRNVYDGDNLMTLNWGCHPKDERAVFDRKGRLAYVGYLGGYWIDKALLSRLSRSAPSRIDVYGLPRPEKRYGLDYKGFAEDLDVLREYQFGLVTISKDPLRREGFSAKHLEYISYGLPVLVPDWRERLDLIQGSIPYNEDDFLDVLDRYSDRHEWSRMSDKAYEQARALDWDMTLRPLEDILKKG